MRVCLSCAMSEVGKTKYQLFVKGIRGENIAFIVHKVSRCGKELTWHGVTSRLWSLVLYTSSGSDLGK